jgi:hypothetical protein
MMSSRTRPAWRSEEGSALPAVLIILTVLSALGGTVLMVFLVQHRFIRRDVHRLQARYAAEAAVYHALARLEEDSVWRPDQETVLLPDGLTGTIAVVPWGGYYLITSDVEVHGQRQNLRALAGQLPESAFDYAVVLGDAATNLSVAGTTHILGNILVGRSGVRPSSFRGEAFKGRIEGNVIENEDLSMPSFDPSLFRETLEQIEALASTIADSAQGTDSTWTGENIRYHEGDLLLAALDSLGETPLTYAVKGNLTLDGTAFASGSRFIATDTLRVRGKVSGSAGLFYGGDLVLLEGGAQTTGQFLSNREIQVQSGAYLSYPSVLFVSGIYEEGERTGAIRINGTAVVDGTLIYPPAVTPEVLDEGEIVVEKGAYVRGGVYSAHWTELHGTVYGSVLTRQLHFYEDPTDYVNWLKDARIDFHQRPSSYLTPIGFGTPELEVLAWYTVSAGEDNTPTTNSRESLVSTSSL